MSTHDLFQKYFGNTAAVNMKHPNMESFFEELNAECLAEDKQKNCNLADVSINEGSESCEGVSVCELCGTSMMTTEDGHLKCMNLNCNGFEFTH